MDSQAWEAQEHVLSRHGHRVLDGYGYLESEVGKKLDGGASRNSMLEINADLRVKYGRCVEDASRNEVIPSDALSDTWFQNG